MHRVAGGRPGLESTRTKDQRSESLSLQQFILFRLVAVLEPSINNLRRVPKDSFIQSHESAPVIVCSPPPQERNVMGSESPSKYGTLFHAPPAWQPPEQKRDTPPNAVSPGRRQSARRQRKKRMPPLFVCQ